ncbi:NYN domain-containing protein [Bacillus tianshenii]|nr:NYN domain-containing protein [Bacillus tianshenii]
MNVLIVDGYNIIGAWPALRKLKQYDLAAARDKLIEELVEYQAFTGERVIVIFDAHLVPGIEKKLRTGKVEVVYTREKETADERIEKLSHKLQKDIRLNVYVATSDYTEQRVTFGQGALRIPAMELLREVESSKKNINERVREQNERKPSGKVLFDAETLAKLDKWRRRK